jgi:hypothetical protein
MSTYTTNIPTFYNLLEAKERFELVFPCNADGEGPFWNDDGSPILYAEGSLQSSTVRLVKLGGGRYRLAENPILEAPTELHWGDEFLATNNGNAELELASIVVPQQFRHLSSVSSRKITPGCSISEKIHELGGGWETLMGGLLIITLPVQMWPKFNEWRSNMRDWILL